jgi:hypothetical protein
MNVAGVQVLPEPGEGLSGVICFLLIIVRRAPCDAAAGVMITEQQCDAAGPRVEALVLICG